MSWTRVLAGAIFLALLDAFLTNRAASTNVGGAETGLASLLGKFLDPKVPAFSNAGTSPSSSSTTTTGPAPVGTPTAPTGPIGPTGPYVPHPNASTTPEPPPGA